MENEIWRDVPGFEGLYQINIDTPEGRCRRFFKNDNVKELSNRPGKNKRIVWSLHKNGVRNAQQAARWIALTYPELVQNEWFPGAEIDHIDTNAMNNHPSNLRWVDRIGQMNNSLTRQHLSNAMKNVPRTGKWVIQLSKNDEILHFYPSTAQASRETGVNQGSISECCNGIQKVAGGFKWKYAKKEAV